MVRPACPQAFRAPDGGTLGPGLGPHAERSPGQAPATPETCSPREGAGMASHVVRNGVNGSGFRGPLMSAPRTVLQVDAVVNTDGLPCKR